MVDTCLFQNGEYNISMWQVMITITFHSRWVVKATQWRRVLFIRRAAVHSFVQFREPLAPCSCGFLLIDGYLCTSFTFGKPQAILCRDRLPQFYRMASNASSRDSMFH